VARRVGVFVDVSNVYYCISKKYPGRKLDYAAYMNYCKDLGEIANASAFGSQLNNEAASFIHCLSKLGYTPKYKTPKSYMNDGKLKRKADHDVAIAIDMINMAPRMDLVVLGTADGDLVPAVQWLKEKGIEVVILACGISRDLKDVVTTWIEIPESMLEAQKHKVNTATDEEKVEHDDTVQA
jgi:uncharacterized LabA/DUF88 family protein